MVGEGFEPSKAKPADLQSAPFDRSGTPPVFPAPDTRRIAKRRHVVGQRVEENLLEA